MDAARADTLVILAERCLTGALAGSRLTLVEPVVEYPEAPNTLLRARVDDGPETVIVKCANEPQGRLLCEWAALGFLAELTPLDGLFPTLHGVDRAQELLVLEDLGRVYGQQLGRILNGTDPQRAEQAVLAYQHELGRLHRLTRSRGERFAWWRQRGGATFRSRHRVHSLLAALDQFLKLPARLELTAPSGLAGELASIQAELAEPGPFLTFTHGDATLANAFFTPTGSLRMYDLETAGFRHALVDGSFGCLRYLHSVWARELPPALKARMVETYRQSLAEGCSEAADDRRFRRGLLCCAAAWLAGICCFTERVLEADRRWGDTTLRQRIVTGLAHFGTLADGEAGFSATVGAARAIEAKLRQIWPPDDCRMGLHPAFDGPDSGGEVLRPPPA